MNFGKSELLLHRFEKQAELAPDTPAVSIGGRELTYAELNSAANLIAGELLRK